MDDGGAKNSNIHKFYRKNVINKFPVVPENGNVITGLYSMFLFGKVGILFFGMVREIGGILPNV